MLRMVPLPRCFATEEDHAGAFALRKGEDHAGALGLRHARFRVWLLILRQGREAGREGRAFR